MEVTSQLHAATGLYPGNNPGIHRTGGWAGPRAVLDDTENRKTSCSVGIPTPDVSSLVPLSAAVSRFVCVCICMYICMYVCVFIYSVFHDFRA